MARSHAVTNCTVLFLSPLLFLAVSPRSVWGAVAEPGVSMRTVVFVQRGVPQAVKAVHREWTQGDGYLESDPKPPSRNPQRLYSAVSIGSGDFHIKAQLTILRRQRSAAAFVFGGNDFFGFEGGHGAMFVTGPWFDGAWGDKIGDPATHMQDGVPFTLECIRKEDILHVLIGDKTVYTQKVSVKALGPVGFQPARSTMRVHEFSATAFFEPYVEPKRRQKVSVSDVDNITRHPLVKPLPGLREADYVRLSGGSILTAKGRDAFVSRDEGVTWQTYSIFSADQEFEMRFGLLIATRNGAAIILFVNEKEAHFSWDRKRNRPKPDCRRPTYAIRSLDGGKTWADLQLIDDSYCGCLNDAIQTRDGNVVVTGQELLYEEGRHTTRPYVSSDDGKTWVKADKVDIEMAPGDHSGLIEATLTQLKDGRLWMLCRSYHGFFYESFSSDEGRTWTAPKPSKVTSTGSPGLLRRLASGRLMLMWNAVPNKGFKRREELSIAFSEDEGGTWTDPFVLLRNPGGRVSYPHLFERAPGEIWFTTHQGHFKGMFLEQDVLNEKARGREFVK